MEDAGDAVATRAATGALGPVIAKLGALLCNENMPDPEGCRSDIEFIKSKLEPAYSHLLRIWDRENLEVACKDWMAEARMLSYDLEDTIDSFRLGVDDPGNGTYRSPFVGMKNQVQELLDQWCEQWMALDDEAIAFASEHTVDDPPSRFLCKDASDLVEVDKKKAELIKLLKEHEMVCIHGFAGMGKTTLADRVYQAVGEQFQCRAFVTISPRPNMMIQILTNIISEVIASAVIKTATDNHREVTDSGPTESIGEADEQCLLDSISELLVDKREVTDGALLAGTSIADGNSDIATLASTGVVDAKTDTAPLADTDTADATTDTGTGTVDTKKILIDRISKFLMNKRKVTAGAPLAGTGVEDKQYLISTISKLLGDKRKVTDSAPLAGTDVVDEQYLVNIISKFLADERYLVIVDDIWHWEQWEVIRKSLQKNDQGSMIITTTRVSAIAEKCCTEDKAFVYEIKGLSMDAAAALSGKIFKESSKAHTVPPDMYSSCSSIAKMSGGMPLAIICLSSAVAQQLSTDALKNRFDVALCEALKGFAKIACMRPLVESLVLGYHCLPVHLQTCLLQCSMYPPNERFERDDLIRIWIAEGFVEEEQAPGYFHELAKWGYISPAEGRRTKVREYEINAVVHAFLRYQTEKYDFVASAGYFTNIECLYVKRIRRASVHGGLNSWDVSRLDFSCMGSLVVFGRASLIPFERLNHLRVLHLDEDRNLEDADLYNYPDLGDDDLVDICGLPLLRYVRLKGCKITVLPPEIGKLQLLETLDLRGTGVRELPGEIGKLQLLKTLNISNTAVTNIPGEIGKLQQLKTLDVSNTNVVQLPLEIGELQRLETLDVSGTNVTERELAEVIEELHHLETLDVSNTKVAKLPMEIWKMQQLKTLNISNINVRELPWEAGQRSNSIRVVAGDKDSPTVVNLLEGTVKNGDICKEKSISITLFDRFGSSWEPIPVARLKIPGKHIRIPPWLKQHLNDISFLQISLWNLKVDDLKILQEMPNLQVLALRVEVLPRTAITGAGFSRLESFCVDCRVPRVTFHNEAMPKLKHLQFKFYAFRATKEEEPMGITNLWSLQRVDFRGASGYNSDAPGISEIINKLRKEAKEHRNLVTLYINGKEDVVQEENSAEVLPVKNIDGAGSSTASVTGTNPPGNDIDKGNDILVRNSGLPKWIIHSDGW